MDISFGKPDKLTWEYFLTPFINNIQQSAADERISEIIFGNKYLEDMGIWGTYKIQLIQNEFSKLDFQFAPFYRIGVRDKKLQFGNSHLFIKSEWTHNWWENNNQQISVEEMLDMIHEGISDSYQSGIWPGKSFSEKDGKEGFSERKISIPFIYHDLKLTSEALSYKWIDPNECNLSNVTASHLTSLAHTPKTIREIKHLPELPPLSWFNQLKFSVCREIPLHDEQHGEIDAESCEDLLEEYKI